MISALCIGFYNLTKEYIVRQTILLFLRIPRLTTFAYNFNQDIVLSIKFVYRVIATTFQAQYGLRASDIFEKFKPYTVFLFFSWIQRKRIRYLFHAAVCRLQISVERHPKDHNAFPKQTKTQRDRNAWENLIKNLPTNMQSQISEIFCIWKALLSTNNQYLSVQDKVNQ